MQNTNDVQYLQCPYVDSHRILPSRFQVHLGRCRRNHKDVPKVTCPFNVCHVLNQPELNFHVTICPERSSFEEFKNRQPIAVENEIESQSISKFALPEIHTESETWDDDPPVPTYNPQAYASNAKILRNLQGATPSERKEFRKEERKRLLKIKH